MLEFLEGIVLTEGMNFEKWKLFRRTERAGKAGWKEEEILPLFFGLRSFLNIHDLLDKNYVIYSEMQSDGRFMVKLFCVNPAENLQKMSGTGQQYDLFFRNIAADTVL